MVINELFKDVEYKILQKVSDEINGEDLEFDSKIKVGDAFYCTKGVQDFISKASSKNGAKNNLNLKKMLIK